MADRELLRPLRRLLCASNLCFELWKGAMGPLLPPHEGTSSVDEEVSTYFGLPSELVDVGGDGGSRW